MRLKKIIRRYFDKGNVCVFGLRGTGKDLLFANVVCKRKKPYISNFDYKTKSFYQTLDFDKLNCGENTYKNMINNDINYYDFTDYYINGSDIFLSDAGIYFPSQYNGELNSKYKYLPTYFALSRQLSENNFHFNAQNLNRVWDKIREQSDIYIMCRRTIYIPIPFTKCGIVLLLWRYYDKYQSAVDRVRPCRVRVPLFNKKVKQDSKIYLDRFFNDHGTIKNHFTIFINKSRYDTYHFKKLFKGGKQNEY